MRARGSRLPTTRCRRCKQPASAHHGERLVCPGGNGKTILYHADRARASTSFNAGEVQLLSDLLSGVTLRKDLSLLSRRPDFTRMAQKISALAETVKITAQLPSNGASPHDVEKRVKAALQGRIGNFTTREVATEIGASHHSVSSVFSRMKAKGLLTKIKHGLWCKAPLAARVASIAPIKAAP